MDHVFRSVSSYRHLCSEDQHPVIDLSFSSIQPRGSRGQCLNSDISFTSNKNPQDDLEITEFLGLVTPVAMKWVKQPYCKRLLQMC